MGFAGVQGSGFRALGFGCDRIKYQGGEDVKGIIRGFRV